MLEFVKPYLPCLFTDTEWMAVEASSQGTLKKQRIWLEVYIQQTNSSGRVALKTMLLQELPLSLKSFIVVRVVWKCVLSEQFW